MDCHLINWFALRWARFKANLENRRNYPGVYHQGQSSGGPFGPDDREMMSLETLASYAGVHPTTIRRWLRNGQIPPPSVRWNRKLYWTHDDAWVVRMHTMPGVYHVETRNEIPMDRNSIGKNVTSSIGEYTL